MKAAVLQEYRKFVWKDVDTPHVGDNDVLIRVEYAGICGSDMHIFNGDFQPRTRIPMIPGHEFGGIVAETGRDVAGIKKGSRVVADPIIWCGECPACKRGHYPACRSLKLVGVDMNGGFAEYLTVKQDMIYVLPGHISARHAALIELYSIGFHAINRADLQENDTVLIWGTGRVGHSILQAVRTRTQKTVICVDIRENRLKKAKEVYPDIITINSTEQDPLDSIREATGNCGVDVAFEAVGHAHEVNGRSNPVRGCVQSIRGAGTVCVLGLGDDPAPVLMKELIWKEARIIASRVSHGEFGEAIKQMAAGHLQPEALISAEIPAAEAQQAFLYLEKEPEKYLKVLLKLS